MVNIRTTTRAGVWTLFTFAVQAVDSPVSRSCTNHHQRSPRNRLRLSAVDRPGLWHSIQLGEPCEEQIILRNSGGGVLEGRMEVPLPVEDP